MDATAPALAAWMDEHGLAAGPIGDVTPIGGGTQNLMIRFRRGGREFVLRRGPRHLRSTSNDALRREIRILQALATTDVPHPRLIAACGEESVLEGAVFYLMEPVAGFNASVELPALHAGDAVIRRAMGFAAVDALAALAAVDHVAVGLGDFGRPDGFLERQVPRWLAQLDGYAVPRIAHADEVAAWLEQHRPADWTPGIMHGDYHLANVMYATEGPDVAAIVDWEMCTIGDPLLDLGWLLATWPAGGDAADQIAGALGQAGGLPAPQELVARYAERSSRDLSAITWYSVLACFKLAIVLEGTHARALAGKADRAVGEQLHQIARSLLARAQSLIEGA